MVEPAGGEEGVDDQVGQLGGEAWIGVSQGPPAGRRPVEVFELVLAHLLRGDDPDVGECPVSGDGDHRARPGRDEANPFPGRLVPRP